MEIAEGIIGRIWCKDTVSDKQIKDIKTIILGFKWMQAPAQPAMNKAFAEYTNYFMKGEYEIQLMVYAQEQSILLALDFEDDLTQQDIKTCGEFADITMAIAKSLDAEFAYADIEGDVPEHFITNLSKRQVSCLFWKTFLTSDLAKPIMKAVESSSSLGFQIQPEANGSIVITTRKQPDSDVVKKSFKSGNDEIELFDWTQGSYDDDEDED
mgnify:FL=1